MAQSELLSKPRFQYINDPSFQLRYAVILAGLGTGCFIVMGFLCYLAAERVAEALPGGESMAVALTPATLFVRTDVLIPLAVLLIFLFCLGIIGTNRFAGPLFAIKRHFDGLQTGRRRGVVQLRANDELQDLAESVNSYIGFIEKRDEEIASTARAAKALIEGGRLSEAALRMDEILILLARSE